ncbi:MAG: siroheme synthase CysG [Methylotetracoccus sp.]
MNFLPVFVKLKDAPCLVVGGGEVAARKVGLLLRAGGRVTVVSPECGPAVGELVHQGRVAVRGKPFEPGDLDGFTLVVSATSNGAVNEQVAAAATQRNIPVNVVDHPELCSFIFPAIVDRDPVIVAVSTGGASPVLARLIRARLEALLPAAYGRLAEAAERIRARVKDVIRDSMARRRFWEDALQGPVAELVFAGRQDEAEKLLGTLLERQAGGTTGMVSLVGAGPGDPDLLTLRALRIMQEADVVVYDRLVSPEIMRLVRTDAERIYAGKRRDDHTMPQHEINELLARLAGEGRHVVRLKGGDPFIFGRGGEEIEQLMDAGIPFQVVPGITAAAGCAAYAGIPLTHRFRAVVYVRHRSFALWHDRRFGLAAPRAAATDRRHLHGIARAGSDLRRTDPPWL